MIRILLASLVLATLTACALPGTPGPLPARDQCALDAAGLRCTEVPGGSGAMSLPRE